VRAIKISLCWVYSTQTAIFLLLLAGMFVPRQASHLLRVQPSVGASILFAGLIVAAGCIFGMAWWTLYKGKTSARLWVILPSVAYVSLAVVIVYLRPGYFPQALVPLAMGFAGPAVTWRRGTLTLPVQEIVIPRVAGDGTSNLLNKCGHLFAVVAYVAAWWSCNNWIARNGLPRVYGGLAVLILVGFLNTLVHELGHTIIGVALEMRLRAFAAGPFEWRKREGSWEFKFNLAGVLTEGGATGVVPTSTRQPRWHLIAMIAAGPLINLYCGAIALAFAYICSMPGNSSPQLAYPLALFGLYGVISFAVNLIPLRSGTNYSDGAKIFQLLSNGPWADLHRAVSVVTSSLVTPLQPRDYDIATIQRASNGIREGNMGVLLRLWAHSHFLDRGLVAQAAQALHDAESVYHASASNISTELHAAFVFGHAFVRRDAGAARQWWDKMQAKKPARLNADYYRAESALHWIEGDQERAKASWMRCNHLAQKLPRAGAYEFGRTCCGLLHRAIASAPGGEFAPMPDAATTATASTWVLAREWGFMGDMPSQQVPSAAVSR